VNRSICDSALLSAPSPGEFWPAVSRWRKADILVNDAGSYPDGTLLEMPADAWDRVFGVNVTGTFMMTQALC
jgi:NAD(P)-dependent dehydrogenase (short-subunit alcohol dehydrogenase family)